MPRTPIHPGEILADELEERGLKARNLAAALEIPKRSLDQILAGKRPISTDTAQRLGRRFGTTPRFWLNLQSAYDVAKAPINPGPSKPN